MYKILELNFIQVIQKMQKYTFKYICKLIDEKLMKINSLFFFEKVELANNLLFHL